MISVSIPRNHYILDSTKNKREIPGKVIHSPVLSEGVDLEMMKKITSDTYSIVKDRVENRNVENRKGRKSGMGLKHVVDELTRTANYYES